ncbi:uncharacterized protein LOC123515206 [Portunus trituberculatus]|uniref:uncharacterized protein LOC123515206 n=1 Tax=Portunus trituberculatus TaxID=210409 RepID=UPI001E1CCB86|nr:uncharacterized protein LOC123515206 [Portunus trituberculatus]
MIPHVELVMDHDKLPVRGSVDTVVTKTCKILLFLGSVCGAAILGAGVTLFIAPQYNTTRDPVRPCDSSLAQHHLVMTTVPSDTLSPDTTSSSRSASESDSVSVHPTTTHTDEERFHKQQEKLRNIAKCQPMPHPVRVNDDGELPYWDHLRDKDLLSPVVPINRCPTSCGLCVWGERCLPTRNTTTSVLLKYLDDNNQIKYEERDLQEHLECSCH